MLEAFNTHIKTALSFLIESKILIAISGGLDSVVLAHLCKHAKLNIALAHCNFNLRGEESDGDEDFVLQLSEDLDLEVFIENFETQKHARNHKVSTQVAARELRYNWFYELAEQLNFDYILTAHHADDNLETFLINFTRGTGLDGLTGIPAVNNKIVRPLLPFSRQELEVYATSKRMSWREDSSNETNKYLRNQLRHDIIPVLKQMNPSLLQNFHTTISNLHETQEIVQDAIANFQRDVAVAEDNVITLNINKIKNYSNPKAYLFETLKDFNFTEWHDVVDLLDAEPGKKVFSNTHELIRDREFLVLREHNVQQNDDSIHIEKDSKMIATPFGTLTFDLATSWIGKDRNTIYVDQESLKYPLTLRKSKADDVFYPIGLKGKKKVNKYFKDEKLSLLAKEDIWLLCSEDAIVWIIGMRADDRYKVTETTKKILKIEFQS